MGRWIAVAEAELVDDDMIVEPEDAVDTAGVVARVGVLELEDVDGVRSVEARTDDKELVIRVEEALALPTGEDVEEPPRTGDVAPRLGDEVEPMLEIADVVLAELGIL